MITKESIRTLIRFQPQIISARFDGLTVEFVNALFGLLLRSKTDVSAAWQVVWISKENIGHGFLDNAG